MRVVERALPDVAPRVHQLPVRAAVVGAEQAAVLVFDERVDPVRIRLGDRDADLPVHALRQPLVARDFRPRLAAVGGLEQAASGTAARHRVLDAVRLPQGGKHDVRIAPVDRDVGASGLRIAEERTLPRLAAVHALEDAALVARFAVVAEVGDVDDVGVGRMDADAGDRLRLAEADVRPRLAGVGRLIQAVAGQDVAADARLAHPEEDDVGVRFGHGDRADRRALDLTVGDGCPRLAAVDRLPQPAADRARVRDLRLPLDPTHRQRASGARRSEAAPLEGLQDRRVDRPGLASRLRLLRTPGAAAERSKPGEDDSKQRDRNASRRAEHSGSPPNADR